MESMMLAMMHLNLSVRKRDGAPERARASLPFLPGEQSIHFRGRHGASEPCECSLRCDFLCGSDEPGPGRTRQSTAGTYAPNAEVCELRHRCKVAADQNVDGFWGDGLDHRDYFLCT